MPGDYLRITHDPVGNSSSGTKRVAYPLICEIVIVSEDFGLSSQYVETVIWKRWINFTKFIL